MRGIFIPYSSTATTKHSKEKKDSSSASLGPKSCQQIFIMKWRSKEQVIISLPHVLESHISQDIKELSKIAQILI